MSAVPDHGPLRVVRHGPTRSWFCPAGPTTGLCPPTTSSRVFTTDPRWRRIYLDLPGRGRTRGEPWVTTKDQVLDIVLEVIETVIPGEQFVIAGHSAGGYLARAVLHRRIDMVDGLLQVVPVIDPDDEDVPEPTTIVADEALVEQMEAEIGPETAARLAASMVVQSADRVRTREAAPARDEPP